MALQIANPVVVAKIEALAKQTGLTKTAAVERAVDSMLSDRYRLQSGGAWERFDALLAQFDLIPEVDNPRDPLEWDEHGLPEMTVPGAIAVDTSALVAIVFDEPERSMFKRKLESASKVLISAVSVVEAKMVVHSRRGQRGVIVLNSILALPTFEIMPPAPAEMDAAYEAFVTLAKAGGHRAGLNFGDIFAYALAKVRGIPLLFKGNDFIHTDIRQVPTEPFQ